MHVPLDPKNEYATIIVSYASVVERQVLAWNVPGSIPGTTHIFFPSYLANAHFGAKHLP